MRRLVGVKCDVWLKIFAHPISTPFDAAFGIRVNVGPSDRTTWLPFALVDEPRVSGSVPVGVPSVVRCCQLLVGLPIATRRGDIRPSRGRSHRGPVLIRRSAHAFEVESRQSVYAAGCTQTPRIGS